VSDLTPFYGIRNNVSEHSFILICFLLPRELKEFAEKLRAEFEQEKRRAVNVATRSLERDLGQYNRQLLKGTVS
jgi:hypothetical protein